MSEQWKTGDEETHAQGGAAESGEEGLGEAPRKQTISTNTLAVVGVFAIALALIWVLGKQAGPRSAAAAAPVDEKVNTAIQEFLDRAGKGNQIRDLFRDTDALVKMFYNYPGVAAVPLEQLPANPFEHQSTGSAPDPIPLAVNPSVAEEARLHRLAESFKTLKLQTVLVSRTQSAAMINNRMVMVGGRIGEFTVTEIRADRVILSAGGAKFELKQAELMHRKTTDPDDN